MSFDLFKIDPTKKTEQKEIGKKGVEADFVAACKAKGWKCYKFVSEMNRGVSDRIVFTPFGVWFVEVKRNSGKLSALQESFRDTCLTFNINHFVVYGIDGIKQFIKEAEKDARKIC